MNWIAFSTLSKLRDHILVHVLWRQIDCFEDLLENISIFFYDLHLMILRFSDHFLFNLSCEPLHQSFNHFVRSWLRSVMPAILTRLVLLGPCPAKLARIIRKFTLII